jgi:hypothetical protein
MSGAEVCARLFPDAMKLDEDGCYAYDSRPSYRQLVDKMGEVVFEATDNNYQGSSYFLLKDANGRHGYLEFGWGSCSGCDALEAACSAEDIGNLWTELNEKIQWFDSLELFQSWANEHDWAGEYSWHDGSQAFIAELNARYSLGIEVKSEDE